MSEPVEDFDPVKAVDSYRGVIARRDAETSSKGTAEFDGIAKRMRAAWAEWQGEDSLHEMAFGELND